MSKTRSFSSEISQRYALALYDLSKDNNQTNEIASNMESFIKLFNSNDNLRHFVKNPTYSIEDQKIVFDKILISSFISLLSEVFSAKKLLTS